MDPSIRSQPAPPDSTQLVSERFLLPASAYTDPNLFNLEQRAILDRCWIYLGDSQQVREPNTVWATSLLNRSILITRTATGELRAFHNVCPHRAARLIPQLGIQACHHLVCPYHAWVYSLDGTLTGVAGQKHFPESFDCTLYPLIPLRLELWSGFMFVCMDPDAPSLVEWLGIIQRDLDDFRCSPSTLLVQKNYTVACNWKNYHDNTLCDYHVAVAHRSTLHKMQGPIRHYRHLFDTFVNALQTPTTPEWQQQHSILNHLTDFQSHFLTYGIFPNLHLITIPNGLMAWIRIDPLTVSTCQVLLEIYGDPEVYLDPGSLAEEFEAFMTEDMAITESVQQGYSSGVYQPGSVSALEARIVHQQRLSLQYLPQLGY